MSLWLTKCLNDNEVQAKMNQFNNVSSASDPSKTLKTNQEFQVDQMYIFIYNGPTAADVV